MGKHKLAFVAFDSAKAKHAVAIAEDGRDGLSEQPSPNFAYAGRATSIAASTSLGVR